MKYQIDTIPVWDALEHGGSCMLCTLQAKTEASEVERTLGASVMEPEVRVQTNEIGVCQKHQQMMFQFGNRLPHALMLDTHAAQVMTKLEKLSILPTRGRDLDVKKIAEGLRALTDGCIVCQTIDAHMQRYIYTLIYLWKTDTKFQQTFSQSKGLCIPHAAALIEASEKQLKADKRREFVALCFELMQTSLSSDESDLQWFIQKFDYKNKDLSWGNSKNAIERTVNRLRGYCLGELPFEKPKK